MNAASLNFKHLYCLLSVAEHESISRAAEIVHLSQPAVTQAVTKIEKLIDQRLFDREAGVGSGFHGDDAYDVYDKPLFNDKGGGIYKPTADADEATPEPESESETES